MAFDVEAALKEGSEKEVAEYLASKHGFNISAARKDGLSDLEIIQHLAPRPIPENKPVRMPPEEDKEVIPAAYGVPLGVLGLGVGAAVEGLQGARNATRWFRNAVERDAALGLNPERPGVAPGQVQPAAPLEPGEKYGKAMHGGKFTTAKDMSTIYKAGKETEEFLRNNPAWTVQEGTGLLIAPESPAQQKAAERLARTPVAKARAALKGVVHSTPVAAARVVGDITGPGIGGYQLGSQGAQAYNRLSGDKSAQEKAAGALNVIGAGTGAASFLRNPKIRYPALLTSGAMNYLADLVAGDQVEEKARGGLAHLADGGKTPKARLAKTAADMLVGRGPKTLEKIIERARPQQTVSNPLRMDYPGIYKRPDVIARRAVENTAPENPLLKQLFGVTRNDLYEMSKRKGNVPGVIPGAAKNPKGSEAAEAIMTPQNETRILDIMSEIQKQAPGMYQGMHGWYVMDPEYQRLVQLVGKDEAARLYRQMNVFGGIESPNMPVPNEFRRASAAHMMAEQGRFPEWQRYGGLSAIEKAAMPDYPAYLMSVPGRVGHKRASTSQNKYLQTGQHGMDSPKAPPYIEASSVPELGFQTDIPVGDAHWSRGVGLADVRTGKNTAESVSKSEIQQLSPWWREKIAAEMGTESVPAQAVMWGGLGPYTGVKTAVGAPKLELHAIEIGDAAKRLNISPETARDLILMGKERAGRRDGGLV